MCKPNTFKTCIVALGLVMMHHGVQAQTFVPVQLTPASFTQEIVVPYDWTYKLNAQSVTVTIDKGPALQTDNVTGYPPYYSLESGDTFFEIGLDRGSATTLTEGLPAGGSLLTSVTLSSHVYQLPYWTNYSSNCVYLGPYTTSGTYNSLPLTDGPYIGQNYNANVNLALNGGSTNYTALSFLCSGGGPYVNSVMISYADGTTQGPVSFGVPNWFVNANTTTTVTPTAGFAFTAAARMNPAENQNAFANTGVTSGSRLWSVDIALSDSTSPPTNLSFSTSAAGSSVIFAVSGGTNTSDNQTIPNTGLLTGPFSPIAVSGYNAGCVVANSPQTLAGLAPLTATMDHGTNVGSGGNTWFEIGWDQAAPTNGFPLHGTILTSGVNTNRTYQMPASYHQPMCVLVDTNHQLANITLVNTNISYTAFSLLTAGASINSGNKMTNFIILQHSDGVNESNLFIGYDWFETSVPWAYSANERVNIGSTSSTTGREVQNLDAVSPKLFESEFQMQDGSPVTNLQVGFLQSPSANSTTYILAVSATTNFIPVQVGTYTAAQNVYAGQNAVFYAVAAFGTLPTYQWQYTDGLTFTNNLVNGPTGTGSTNSGVTTPTLTVANVSSLDAGYYTCLIANNNPSSAGSPLAPLTLLTSTQTNIVQPGDPITDFGETIATPAGLGVANAIDGTIAAYLNYGSSGSTAGPFQGPVGIVVTPNAGSAIVTALRFYTAVNAPICDPADFMLEGSNDGGNTWTTVVADTALSLPNSRNLATALPIDVTNQVLQEVDFANTTSYSTYRLTVNNVKSDSTANSMQIAEIQFLGVLGNLPPGILTQPSPPVQNLQVGGSITWSIVANGPPPITYQWYQVVNNVTNAVTGATNASFGLQNATTNSTGSYFVTASNNYGSTNSTSVTVNVLPPSSAYVSTVIADGPIAFLRLDEGPDNGNGDNGTIAYDSVGGHNGTYTNVILQVPGYSVYDTNDDYATGFGFVQNLTGLYQDNFVNGISGINFATPTNTATNFSVEAWVNLNANSVSGAAIAAQGWGGGEQWALDTGGTSEAFRFYFRTAGANSITVSSNTAPALHTWYHVVGVLDETNNTESIYINGQLGATTVSTPAAPQGLLATNTPIVIGSRRSSSATNYNLQLTGSIDNVAIYPYALSSNQIMNHYLASGILPTLVVVPTNATFLQGQTAPAIFYSSAIGTPQLTYQWQLNGANLTDGPLPSPSTATVSGSSTPTLMISGATSADNGDSFSVTVTNVYGSSGPSGVATLTIAAGPPVVQTDVQPIYTVFGGLPVSISATITGTAPLQYQWTYDGTPLQNGPGIIGANSNILTISPTTFAESGTYQLLVTNAVGNTESSQAVLNVLPVLTFNGLGVGWSLIGNAEGGFTSANTLELTDGQGSEARASFFSNAVYVGGFQAKFTYTDVNGVGAEADGACFVVQNDPRGPAALGGGGGDLGYTGIMPSVALEFNIYAGNTVGGVGVGLGENGTVATVANTSPVAIDLGDPINVTVTYLGGEVSLFLQDAIHTNETFSTSAAINVAAVVGTNVAYVGFVGGDGGTVSTQTISNFQFTSLVNLAAQTSGANIILSWPAATSSYQVESSPSLSAPDWVVVTNAITLTNNQYQITLPHSSTTGFYRLQLQ
jgi:hypothetical protein